MFFKAAQQDLENLKLKAKEQLEREEQRAKKEDFYGWYERSLKAKVTIDWATMRVFSVERAVRKHPASCLYIDETILGYFKSEGVGKEQVDVIGEWVLECSMEEHNRLVDSFEKYLATKSKK